MGGRIEKQYEVLEDILAGVAKPRNLPLALLEDITDHFSEERKIGGGGFGTVYKGVLRNKNVVVKKMFVNEYTVDDRLLDREVDTLMRIKKHPNLVRFLGFCSNTARVMVEQTGSEKPIYQKVMDILLCFEYISKGSLDKHITDEFLGLTWDTRFDIIRGICEGLRCLHEDKSIIHIDLKPANILLDENMVPKITDFGLSVSAENKHTKSECFFTLGYCSPEYLTYGQMSDRADIYSLGVVIVELVTGTKHIPDITHVLRRWTHRWNKSTTRHQHQQVIKCMEIAVQCSLHEPKDRPSISDIIRDLSEIGSTNGSIGKTSLYRYDEMLGIYPLELRFPLEHSKQTSCSVELTNDTSNFIAFNIRTPSKQYNTQPERGIVLPGCKCVVKITLEPEESATQVTDVEKFILQSTKVKESLTDSEKFVVQSTIVKEGLADKDITDYMFKIKDGRVVDEVNLMVVHQPEKCQVDLSLERQEEAVSESGSMTLQYLKDITNNFSDDRILGKGGFGEVYKGLLHDGKMVAVKKILQATPSSQTQFENEVNLLMKLKHQNIVRLIGYCYETRHLHMPYEGKSVFAGHTESFLCLEFLPNGSLDKYISDASSGLSWLTRCKVIEGISYGLQYLHEHSNESIIHLDLKPANILLDANMLPKITDFGLSRLFDQSQTIYTAIRGTFGYMPPEFLRGTITPKSDIFSLGVIIMEVITGHRDYPDDIRKSSEGFIELELQKWRNRLQKEPGYTSIEIDCQQIERCMQIGLICVNPKRTKRPTMKKIIDMLEGSESMDWYISNELSSHGLQSEP